MKKSVLSAVACVAVSQLFAVPLEMPLEWNPAYDVSAPYEVEIQPAKLQSLAGVDPAAGFTVKAKTAAGEQPLKVVALPGKVKGAVLLRFTVPAGTTTLSCTAGEGKLAIADATITDNLFAGVLAAEALDQWKLQKCVTATALVGGGVALKGSESGSYNARRFVDVPAELAGRPVAFELDVTSRTKMTWGGQIELEQYDAAGKLLPERVTDIRWTGHMRPCDKLIAYRERGRIHPEAKRIALCVELRGSSKQYDEYGMPITDPSILLPKLDITHLALRPAAELPFPKYNDDFFTAGVSARPHDTAFNFNGERAIWYQTRSWASWSQATQLRKEEYIFFPSAAGTVEAWYKATKQAEKGTTVILFTARHHQADVPKGSAYKESRDNVCLVSYSPDSGKYTFRLKDSEDAVFEKSVKADFPIGRWFHLAACWAPGAEAKLFLDGKCVLSFDAKAYRPYDLVNSKKPNDYHCTEFYVGCHPGSTRFAAKPKGMYPLFSGAVDLLRVSTGMRYSADFTPAKEFACDAATRALFTFDRSFDGVSGGGIGWIPGTVWCLQPRVTRKLELGGRTVQYFPAEIVPENHHDKVLNRLNYPDMPTPAEFRAARVSRTASARVAPGGKFTAEVKGKKAYMDFVEYVNDSTEPLVHPLVINRGEIDPRSFGDIADSLGVNSLSDRDRANAVFNFVLGASDYFMSHQSICDDWSDVPRCVEYEALVMLNSYCGFECGPLNNLAANMFAASGRLPSSQTGGYGHSFEQVFYDGKNHIYDLSAQKFFPAMDNETAAYLAEDDNEPGIHSRLGGGAGSFIRNGNRGHHVQSPSFQPKVALTLNPGESFKVWFMNDGTVNDIQHNSRYCGNRRTAYHIANRVAKGYKPYKEFEYECSKETGLKPLQKVNSYYRCPDDVHVIDNFFPHYGNGFIRFDGIPAGPAVCEVKADSFCYLVRSCYPVVAGNYAVETKSGLKPAIEISTDRKVFDKVGEGTAAVDYRIRSRNVFLVRVNSPLNDVKRFSAATEVMVNPRILPGKLKAGMNELTFKATKGAPAKVTVGWRENANEIVIEGGLYAGMIPGCERQLVVLNPAKELVLNVRGASKAAKAFAYNGLAATLDDGKLTLRAGGAKDMSLAAVDVVDGDAVKSLTVLVSSCARLLTASEAKLAGGAKLVNAGVDAVQASVVMTKEGVDRLTFNFEKLPAGEYVLLNVTRFASHPGDGSPHDLGLRPFCMSFGGKVRLTAAGPRNDAINFYKAHYGHKGERAAWKWDYPNEELSEYPYHLMKYFTLPETDSAEGFLNADRPEGVEFAGALVLKAPTRAFKRELMKVLCGMNCDPWHVK